MKKYFSPILCLLVIGLRHADGQSCTANLGTPLVNYTFGAGPNYGPALPPGVTNLTYVASYFPQDGQYTIASSLAGGGTWVTVPQDHTGNTNGYFMFINANYQPSDFFVQTVTDFCQGMTYQFGAWILNRNVPTPNYVLPNITFSVEQTDGTVLQSYNTGDIPAVYSATWRPYSFLFTVPPGVTTLVLRMHNNAPGGSGNDLCLDDVTFIPAGPAVNIQASSFSGSAGTVCAGSPLSFSSTVPGNCYAATAYQWQVSLDNGVTWSNIPGATNSDYTFSPTTPGRYVYRLKVGQAGNLGSDLCCVFSNLLAVIVQGTTPSVTITTSADPVCPGVPVTFTATSANGGFSPAYQWMVNGNPAGTGGSTYTTSGLDNGDVVSCALTSNATCAYPNPVTSNAIAMSISPLPSTADAGPDQTQYTSGIFTMAANTPVVGTGAWTVTSGTATIADPSSPTTTVTIPVNTSATLRWTITPVGNVCTVSSSEVTLHYLRAADLSVIKQLLTREPLAVGGKVTFQLTVTNHGPNDAGGITVSDILPANLGAPSDITAPAGTVNVDPATNTLVWTLDTLANGTSQTLTFATRLNSGGTLSNTATVRGDLSDPVPGNNSSATPLIAITGAQLFIPNVITPNGDGKNDRFVILGLSRFPGSELSVYNRWGNEVYHSGSYDNNWDGSGLNTGTYYYILKLRTEDGKPPVYKGWIQIMK